MIEIALCLAIIGFALVSILLVLPTGMNTQRDTRQETIIGQDASVLLEAIRNGARGLDDLTNYVYAITNYSRQYIKGVPGAAYTYGYTYTLASVNNTARNAWVITNGMRIVGILSTPEFTLGSPPQALQTTSGGTYTSNHIVAYVRSFSGLAAEKPPQDNPIMQGDTFTYRVLSVNAPMAADTNALNNSGYARELAGNLRELRLLFMWPQLPNGNVGGWRQPFRATVGGQLVETNDPIAPSSPPSVVLPLYFYQPQSFGTNAP